jgi:hypothetical protein
VGVVDEEEEVELNGELLDGLLVVERDGDAI